MKSNENNVLLLFFVKKNYFYGILKSIFPSNKFFSLLLIQTSNSLMAVEAFVLICYANISIVQFQLLGDDLCGNNNDP